MADIELIIKIPEDSYKATCNEYMFPEDVKAVINAIKKGTPIPEHYGDLIDRDKVLDDIVKKNPEWVSETGKRKRYARLVYYWAVKNAKAVIEGSEELYMDDEKELLTADERADICNAVEDTLKKFGLEICGYEDDGTFFNILARKES